jgi:hypothetical protein
MPPRADDQIDFQFLAYGLAVRYGAAALARVWDCPEVVVHQILNEEAGTQAIHDDVVEIVQTLGASEIAERAGVKTEDVFDVLDYGKASERLVRFVTRHSVLPPSYSCMDAAAKAALN